MRWISLFVLVCAINGCGYKKTYILETGSPDVWDDNPKQSINIKIQLNG